MTTGPGETGSPHRASELTLIDAVIRVTGLLSSSTASSRSALEKQGITYKEGKLRVKTDRPPPSRDEYIQKTQRAFEEGARKMAARADAFAFGKSSDEGRSSPAQGQSSAVPTP